MESILTQLIYGHTLRLRVQADTSHPLEASSKRLSNGKHEETRKGNNIQGRINNLVTTDMATIAPGRDFLTVGAHSSWVLRPILGGDGDGTDTSWTLKCCGHLS